MYQAIIHLDNLSLNKRVLGNIRYFTHACGYIYFLWHSCYRICVLAGGNQRRIIILLLLFIYVYCDMYSHESYASFFNEYCHFHYHFQNVNSVNKIVNYVNSLWLI